jgi:hypothetical protein
MMKPVFSHILVFLICTFLSNNLFAADFYVSKNDNRLANGKEFENWEKPLQFGKTYYVNQQHPKASDANAGTEKMPFKTIQRAAEIVKAGERVIIHSGIYRESVHPVNGGTSPEKMISYEAAPSDSVVICGSVLLPGALFRKSEGWTFSENPLYNELAKEQNVWQLSFLPEWFGGYNPFGMLNLPNDIEWLDYKKATMKAHFQRRGLLFVNGNRAEQVATPAELAKAPDYSFWTEHNGMRIHLKLPTGKTPSDFQIEATNKEQVFAPKVYGLGYIRLKGITFRHAGNGFPVPQRGLVSTTRGHHWIVENCNIEWANSVGIDMGNESWSTVAQAEIAQHIMRRTTIRNCGISGLQCYVAKSMLVEDNLFESIGFHDAEHAFESGGIKFHQAENCLIRRNVFSKITHAPGLWLDYKSNRNCRITANLFSEITTARGGIYIEVSRNNCLVDYNVFYKMRCQTWLSGEYGAGGSALYTDGSDSIRFENNLVIDAENTGFAAYLNAERLVDMRGGITCDHRVVNNIFIDCKKYCIEFANTRNFSDSNLYLNPKPGYIKIGNPAPAWLLDIEATNKLYGWDKNSKRAKVSYQLDTTTQKLTLTVPAKLAKESPFSLSSFANESIFIDPRNIK